MSFNQSDIEKIAHLARLNLEPGATEKTTKDLNNIIDMIEQINQADTTGIHPMSHSFSMSQRLRADEANEPNVVNKMQKIAPEGGSKDNLYLVPLVIE